MPFREYTVNRTAWADSYMSDQPSGFIFAPPALADAVFWQSRSCYAFGMASVCRDSALEASKRDADRIQQLKRKLASAGYYRDAPFDIRPLPDRLRRLTLRARQRLGE